MKGCHTKNRPEPPGHLEPSGVHLYLHPDGVRTIVSYSYSNKFYQKLVNSVKPTDFLEFSVSEIDCYIESLCTADVFLFFLIYVFFFFFICTIFMLKINKLVVIVVWQSWCMRVFSSLQLLCINDASRRHGKTSLSEHRLY